MILIRDKKLYSLPEAGALLNLPPENLDCQLREGRLSGRRIGREWYIDEESLNRFSRTGDTASTQVFVARQPIFDSHQQVLAYELLFRSGLANACDPTVSLDKASSCTIASSFLVIGIDTLTNSKKAFVNLTRNLLIGDVPRLLPKEHVVVEILEGTVVDDEVIRACRGLKEAGFVLALDDFIYDDSLRPLIELADIIKVDFLQTCGAERSRVIERVDIPSIRFLAEKVETVEEFNEAVSLGYSYFQGYYFSRPQIMKGRDIPAGKINYLRLIQEVNRTDMGFERLENIIKHDLSLSYKLLRLINSSFFGFSAKIESLRHALVLLGEKEIRKWASLLALTGMAHDKPRELVSLSVMRARFCESLASSVGLKERGSDCFLLGMFSLLDALVDRPLADILCELPLSEDVRQGLLGSGNVFDGLLQLTLAYEKGQWLDVRAWAVRFHISEDVLPELYLQAVAWANNMLENQ